MPPDSVGGIKPSTQSIHHHDIHKHSRKRPNASDHHHTTNGGDKSLTSSSHVPNGTNNTSAKNVSHVPCKFFKQGMCQAGDKCPFSHDIDAEKPAVCKYFEKGNCKFGAKCALLHLGPDGKPVNRRSTKSPRTSSSIQKPRVRLTDNKDFKESGPNNTQIDIEQHHATTIVDPALTGPAAVDRRPLNMQASTFTPRSPYAMRQGRGSFPSTGTPVASIFDFQAMRSSSMSVIGSGPGSGSGSAFPWFDRSSNSTSLYEGSAITDDDEEDLGLEGDYAEQEEGFEEGLLPSTLSDLLTPQERQRRTSRNSRESAPRPQLPQPPIAAPKRVVSPTITPPVAPTSSLSGSVTSELWGTSSRYQQQRYLTTQHQFMQLPSQLVQNHSVMTAPIGSPPSGMYMGHGPPARNGGGIGPTPPSSVPDQKFVGFCIDVGDSPRSGQEKWGVPSH